MQAVACTIEEQSIYQRSTYVYGFRYLKREKEESIYISMAQNTAVELRFDIYTRIIKFISRFCVYLYAAEGYDEAQIKKSLSHINILAYTSLIF